MQKKQADGRLKRLLADERPTSDEQTKRLELVLNSRAGGLVRHTVDAGLDSALLAVAHTVGDAIDCSQEELRICSDSILLSSALVERADSLLRALSQPPPDSRPAKRARARERSLFVDDQRPVLSLSPRDL